MLPVLAVVGEKNPTGPADGTEELMNVLHCALDSDFTRWIKDIFKEGSQLTVAHLKEGDQTE